MNQRLIEFRLRFLFYILFRSVFRCWLIIDCGIVKDNRKLPTGVMKRLDNKAGSSSHA